MARNDAPPQVDYDLVVLGGGSGGLAGALRAAAHGARVALLEPHEFGGTCVNRGCVPKKAMWLAADLASRITLAADLGFDTRPPALDWKELVAQRQRYIGNIHGIYRGLLEKAGVAWMPCRGRLVAADMVETDTGVRLKAGHVLVATGGQPLRPDIPGAELGGVSDDFFRLCAAPPRVAIVGGGYVAVELAGVLQALGSRVELFARGPRLLGDMDGEIVQQLQEDMRQHGVHLHLQAPVHALEAEGGRVRVLYKGAEGDAAAPDAFDSVLFATGRRPNTDGPAWKRWG